MTSGTAHNESSTASAQAVPGSGIEREFAEREALESTLDRQAEVWRQEVSSRVEGYRVRRSKKTLAGEFSMKLDFEARVVLRGSVLPVETVPPEPEPPPRTSTTPERCLPEPAPREPVSETWIEPRLTMEPVAQTSVEFDPPPAGLPVPPASVRRPEPAAPRQKKVIEFPRSLIFPDLFEQVADPNELAETIIDKPRILDASETVAVPAPPLSDVTLDLGVDEEAAPPPSFDLPLRVASLTQRFAAAVLDWLLVLVGTGVFGAIALRALGAMPLAKPMLGLAVAVPVLFWAIYQYLFLVHAAATPGMRAAGIRMSTFEGDFPLRNRRRWRALVLVLSGVSLGFGFLWALFDEDNLCWHDKVTRTYLTSAR